MSPTLTRSTCANPGLYNEALKCKTVCALGYHHVNGYLKATFTEGTHFSNLKLHQYLYRYHSRACKFDDPVPQKLRNMAICGLSLAQPTTIIL